MKKKSLPYITYLLFILFTFLFLFIQDIRAESTETMVSADRSPLYLPNSYIVSPGNEVEIPVSKAYIVWEILPQLVSTQPDLSGSVSAELIWQDKQSLVSSIRVENTGKNAVIYVSTNSGIEGNALVAVKIGDEIRWCWHLWITGYDPEEEKISYSDEEGDISFMSRNLGAVEDEDGLYDLLYQFGRHTPFTMAEDLMPGQNYIRSSKKLYTIGNELLPEGNPTGGKGINTWTVSEENNLADIIRFPLNFYIGIEGNEYDWISNGVQHTDTLWRNNKGMKGIFDPSPEGWRVPAIREYAFLLENDPMSVAVFSRNGSRDYTDGSLFMTGRQGMYWSASVNGAWGSYLFVSDDFISPFNSHYRSNGYAVRCIKNESFLVNIPEVKVETQWIAYSREGKIFVEGVSGNEDIQGLISLYNMQGQLVAVQQLSGRNIIGENLSPGVYLIRLSGSHNRTQKVVVN